MKWFNTFSPGFATQDQRILQSENALWTERKAMDIINFIFVLESKLRIFKILQQKDGKYVNKILNS